MRMWTRAMAVGAVGLVAGGAIGCAQERPSINRVQPDALAKSFFVGEDLVGHDDDPEFFAQGTVVDVGYGAAQDGLFTSTYAQPVTRVKWEIREDQLIGRLTYQRVDDTDHKGIGAESIDGQVAYVYPIQSHFDIKRDYNPATGEESNVIVENSSDSPWYQRKYMRVDWSQNLAKDGYDYDTLSLMGIYGGVTYEPLAYYVNNPDDKDAPHFNPEAGYFDVTNKAFATPGIIDLSGLGWGVNQFPACFLDNDILGGSAPAGNCNPVEITLRQSFRKVEKTDYEPVDWDGYRFQAFGVFTTERKGYNRQYGMTDQQWHRFASRYNIWDKSHAYVEGSGKDGAKCPDGWTASTDFPGQCEVACNTPTTIADSGDPNAQCNPDDPSDCDVKWRTGTADACTAVTDTYGAGSQCDTFKQKCTLPYAQRTAEPIVWHVTKGSNFEFYQGTEWATHEWDVAMREAVIAAKFAECSSTATANGLTEEDCDASYPIIHGQMDDNQDAVQLAREVDDCRNLEHKSQDECNALADSLSDARGYADSVRALAKEPEMLVLCHSPVEVDDSPLCVADIKKKDPQNGNLRSGIPGEDADSRAVLPKDVTAADCDRLWYPASYNGDGLPPADPSIKEACDNGYVVRQGDLRFHQVNLIKEPQTPSAWGIMTDSDDPLSGEKVAASINVWTHVNDIASQQAIDIVRYIKGELATADITDGKYVADWAAAAEAANGRGVLGTMDKATVAARVLAATDGRSLATGKPAATKFETMQPDQLQQLRAFRAKLLDIKASPDVSGSESNFVNARRLAAQNTTTEAELVTPTMMQMVARDLASLKGNANVSAGALSALQENASILRMLNPDIQRKFRQAKENALGERGACILSGDEAMAPAPNSMAALADVLERKFSAQWGNLDGQGDVKGRETAMRKFIAQRYQYGVIIHEMGHSIGERHNFVSSSMAWAYKPQYWQLRTKDGTVTDQCEDASDGEGCVGPRYLDPLTKDESDNLIHMFMQSSVMEYPGEITQDMQGLGGYDFAAARMFYGDVISVHTDPSYKEGSENSAIALSVTDNFGGITGYTYSGKSRDYHYSELQKQMKLIQDCHEVNPDDYKPAHFDESKYGTWDPLLDGLIVKVNGKYTRCRQQPVSFVDYSSMRLPKNAGNFSGGAAIDSKGRTRVPYPFASDNWADTGNVSVFRHDNGADPYELYNFFITEQETRHIFDNYRRNRSGFSVRAASTRILERYNEKMRDATKGLGLYKNIYRDFLQGIGQDPDALWPTVANANYQNAAIASGVAFDHFARQLQRPESGPHISVANDTVLRADGYGFGNPGTNRLTVPDGASGYFGQVQPGGKLVENQLSNNHGDYDSEYTLNAGSYYDKLYVPYLLTESVDNFISASLPDFVDGRYRAVGIADMFPDGYRRMLANNLTGDDAIKGARVAGNGALPDVDADKLPNMGMAFTTWWTQTPESCFPSDGSIICTAFGCDEGQTCGEKGIHALNPRAPSGTIPVDPEVGWEQQKFLVAQTLLYLPENQKETWVNQLGIWELGSDSDPGFDNRIELHLPDGKIYIAKTYGTEELFGNTVQRGIGARVLEWANQLMAQAYETTSVTQNGVTWYLPVVNADGNVNVLFDPTIGGHGANCSATDNTGCTCDGNRSCTKLTDYESVPAFIRQSLHDFRMADPTMRGIYE